MRLPSGRCMAQLQAYSALLHLAGVGLQTTASQALCSASASVASRQRSTHCSAAGVQRHTSRAEEADGVLHCWELIPGRVPDCLIGRQQGQQQEAAAAACI